MDATRLIVAGDKPVDPVAAADDLRRTAETSTPLLGRYAPFGSSHGSSTGVVWEAEDVTAGGRVRCKIVAQTVLPSATWIERALRELKQLSKVATPRLHKILDQGRSEGGELVIVQESMDSPALDEVIRQGGPLSPPRAWKLVQQIGEALIEAQKVGVIHRDVAPQNVFVLEDDQIKVSDFAIAAPVNDKVFGTPQFLSPEQAEGKVPDQRSNIYSLAAVMFYAVTGEAPFGGDAEAQLRHHLSSAPPTASTRRPGLPEALDKVLVRALDKSPSKRHLTLKQLLTELEQACAGVAEPDAKKGARPKREPAATMLGIPSPFTQGAQTTPSAKTAVMSTAAAQEIAGQSKPAPGGMDANTAAAVARAKVAEAEGRAAAEAKAAEKAAAERAAADKAAADKAGADKAAAERAAAERAAAERAAADKAAADKAAAERAAAERAAADKAAKSAPVNGATPDPAAAQAARDKAAAEKAAAALAAKERADAEERAAREAAAARAAKEAAAPRAEPAKKPAAPPAAAPAAAAGGKPKGGFRETAWFKRGEIEEELAKRQAEAASKGDAADPLNTPVGTTGEMKAHTDDTGADLSGEDVNRLSLRTGATQAMSTIKPPSGAPIKGERMNEDDLLAEVDSSKKRLTIAAIVFGVVVLIVVLFLALRPKSDAAPPAAPAKVGALQLRLDHVLRVELDDHLPDQHA